MSKLKPCPFCGGEAKLELTTQYYTGEPEMENAFIRCMKCGVWTDEYEYATEAVAAWNTRHEETCKLHEVDALTQTLSMVNGCAWSECSECGYLTPDDSTYCINCGRKVEG